MQWNLINEKKHKLLQLFPSTFYVQLVNIFSNYKLIIILQLTVKALLIQLHTKIYFQETCVMHDFVVRHIISDISCNMQKISSMKNYKI